MARARRKLLIVDGYNVLRSGSRYRCLRDAGPNPDYADDAFNRAREALINDVVAYAIAMLLLFSTEVVISSPTVLSNMSAACASCFHERGIRRTKS